MRPRQAPLAVSLRAAGAEALAWWIGLSVLWLVLVSSVDTLELLVGAAAAVVGALAATAARRVVATR